MTRLEGTMALAKANGGMGISLLLQVFGHQIWKNCNFDKMTVLEENSENQVIRLHYLGTMDICTKFCANSCYISVWTKVIHFHI